MSGETPAVAPAAPIVDAVVEKDGWGDDDFDFDDDVAEVNSATAVPIVDVAPAVTATLAQQPEAIAVVAPVQPQVQLPRQEQQQVA